MAARGLGGTDCDLCLVFAGAPHLGRGKWILSSVHDHLEPRNLIGCGAGGVVGAGREVEEGPAAVVWAASMPDARIETQHFATQLSESGFELDGLPDQDSLGEVMVALADPYSFATEALLARVEEIRAGMPVLGVRVTEVGGHQPARVLDENGPGAGGHGVQRHLFCHIIPRR